MDELDRIRHPNAGVAHPLSPGDSGRFPDFFLVGHPKCGTSAMYSMLRQHPQIFMPEVKEPRYFVGDGELATYALRTATLAEYLGLFAGASPSQKVGEASPNYLGSATAAAAIAAANPDARIIAVLREPASLVRSLHQHRLREGAETISDLEVALDREPTRPMWLRYSNYTRFVDQLERYRRVFPAEQVLVLIYDDFRSSNIETIRRIFSFVGVTPLVDIQPVERNASVDVRSVAAAQVARRLRRSAGSPAGSALRRATPPSLRRAAYAIYGRVNHRPSRPEDGQLMDDLRARFAPEVRRLSAYLGRDLGALWGHAHAPEG
jgi:hypothetical protein